MTELVGLGFTVSDARTGQRLVANVVVRGGDDLNFTAGTCQSPADQGYVFCNVGRGRGTLTISKAGYKTLTVERDFPGETNVAYALEPDAAPRPTRDQVLAVKGSYCSRRDSTGRVVFEPFIGRFWLDGDMATVNDWIDGALVLGCTHFTTAFQSDKYGSYPVDGFDFTGREQSFRDMLSYLLDRGLIPRVFLTSGDTPA